MEGMMGRTIQHDLRALADVAVEDPDIEFTIVHLMANSESERTLLCNIGGSSKYS